MKNVNGALPRRSEGKVKQSFFLKPVNYQKLIDELWKTKISEDKEVDNA